MNKTQHKKPDGIRNDRYFWYDHHCLYTYLYHERQYCQSVHPHGKALVMKMRFKLPDNIPVDKFKENKERKKLNDHTQAVGRKKYGLRICPSDCLCKSQQS